MDSAAAYLIGAVFVIALVSALSDLWRRPKEKQFRCAKCAKTASHTRRTIGAWRQGKRRFFCAACHGDWLRNQVFARPQRRAANAGCLPALAMLTLIPLLAIHWFVG